MNTYGSAAQGDLTVTVDQLVTEWDGLGRPVRWHGQAAVQNPHPSPTPHPSPLPKEREQEGDRAWLACRRCGAELDRLQRGAWVATWPGRAVTGYKVTKLFSAQFDLMELIRGLHSTNEDRRMQVYNQDLAEPYSPRGGQLTDEISTWNELMSGRSLP